MNANIFCSLFLDKSDLTVINKNIQYLSHVKSSYPFYLLVDKENKDFINICIENNYNYILIDLNIQPIELNLLTFDQFDLICFINSKTLITDNIDFIFSLYNENNSNFTFFYQDEAFNSQFIKTSFFSQNYLINKDIFLCKPNINIYNNFKFLFNNKQYKNKTLFSIIRSEKDLNKFLYKNYFLNLKYILLCQKINPFIFPFFNWIINITSIEEYALTLKKYCFLMQTWIKDLDEFILNTTFNK